MTDAEKQTFLLAVAEENAGRDGNVAANLGVAERLRSEARNAVAVVGRLKELREAAGLSLADLETRTGMRKSALSRLDNSKAPNPTLATL